MLKYIFSLYFVISTFCSTIAQEGVYYSRKVFTFDVSAKDKLGRPSRKVVHLTTFNEVWAFDNRQMWIGWEDQLSNIKRKSTGVIEDSSWVFLHPPRFGEYAILEFSPFPMARFPLEVGARWDWSLEVSAWWAARAKIRFISEDYTYNHRYYVKGQEQLVCMGIRLKCYVIEATCTSKFGGSKLTAHYNNDYGFVRMDYFNMDGSRYLFKLVRVRNLSDLEKLTDFQLNLDLGF